MTAMTLEEKFKHYYVDESGCWIWKGWINANGYGAFRHPGLIPLNTNAHRRFYEHLVGPIPPGLVVDHLCKKRSCVNPDHMDVVTRAINTSRSSSPNVVAGRNGHCAKGHLFTPGSTQKSRKWRTCKICQREWRRQNKDRFKKPCQQCGAIFGRMSPSKLVSAKFCSQACCQISRGA